MPKNEYKDIETHLIDAPQHMIRLTIDQDYIKELAENIRTNGLLQAIVVKPRNDRYEIIAGHRRFLAVASLGWTKITAHIHDVPDIEIAISRASENITRVDMSPIEEGLTYKDLADSYGLSYDAIADRMGKSPGLIKRRIDLLKMPQEMQNAIHTGKIGYGVAEALEGIADRTAQSYYLSVAIDNGITVDVARQWARDWKMSLVTKGNDVVGGDNIPSAYESMPTYTTCEVCHGATDVMQTHLIRACPECNTTIKAARTK